MSHGVKEHTECSICLNTEEPKVRTTRNSKKDNWIRCDCCKNWIHASCGGFTQSQYNKIKKDNVWLKCIVCCFQQLCALDCEEDSLFRTNSVISAAKRRVSVASSDKGGKKKLTQEKQSVNCEEQHRSGNIQNLSHFATEESSSELELKGDRVGSNTTATVNETDCGTQTSEHKAITVSVDTDVDKILIVDKINNPVEYSSSKRILKEIHNFCPEVKIDFAYSLAKGGVAIHTTCKRDRDFLIDNLPTESFGGGVRHPPTGNCGEAVFLKGVDTSVTVNCLTECLQQEEIDVLDIRRLTKRHTGKPTQVVKVKCNSQSVSKLLNINLVINNKRCVIEKERKIKVIRCFNCQRLGHCAKNCKEVRHCENCADSHGESEQCTRNALCYNCGGPHTSASASCPAYIARYEILAKQYSEFKYVSASSAKNSAKSEY